VTIGSGGAAAAILLSSSSSSGCIETSRALYIHEVTSSHFDKSVIREKPLIY